MLLKYIFLIPIINVSYISYSLAILFTTFFLKSLFLKRTKASTINPRPINISILIPIYNEEENLPRLINSFYNDDSYPKCEIIFINDLSTDKSLSILQKNQSKYKYKLVENVKKGCYVAGVLNEGLKHVDHKSNYVGVINGDCTFRKDLLNNVISELMEKDISILNLSNISYYTNVCEYVAYLEKIFKNGLFKTAEASLNNGYFIKKSILLEVGGWNKDILTEDLELNLRLKNHGYTIHQSDLQIIDSVPKSFNKLFNQKYRWIKGDIINRYKYYPKDLFELIVNTYYIFPLFSLIALIISPFIVLRNIFFIQILIFFVEGSLFYKFTKNIGNSIVYPFTQFIFSLYFYIKFFLNNSDNW
uniref:Glycosyltransferase 2-like domain-containing protein n=1 Tax=viral metagenome TaxID=1070528 RepID=A0A6C0EIP4_9ZZZZ